MTYSKFPLAVYFTCGNVCFNTTLSIRPTFSLPRYALCLHLYSVQFSSVSVQLFAAPGIAAHQASLSITNSRSLLKLMSIESVMPSSQLILYCPLLLLPPIPPSIRVFSNESTLRMRWPKYCSTNINRFISTIFPDTIYMCSNTTFVFLFLTYFTLCNRL